MRVPFATSQSYPRTNTGIFLSIPSLPFWMSRCIKNGAEERKFKNRVVQKRLGKF